MTTVITGFRNADYELYGKRFLTTFARYWPDDVKLYYYIDGNRIDAPRGVCLSQSLCNGLDEFLARHQSDPEKCGRKPSALWKPKYIARGYNFRFDAVKFIKQLMIPEHAAMLLPDGEVMAWLDGDVVSINPVPPNMIETLLGDADLCFLGRTRIYSEIGFWAVRLNVRTRLFVNLLAGMYRSDAVFDLPEWHSAFVFDHCRGLVPGLKQNNLTPNGNGHVWMQSPLAAFSDHCKGERKMAGVSPERKSKKG